MSETTSEAATVEETETTSEVESAEVESEQSESVEGESALGDAGKKALNAMKAEKKAALAQAREARTALEKLQAELALKDKPAEEQALEAAKAEARAEAMSKANERILRSELRAAATGKLADPTDAALYIDLTSFEVGDDGDVDSDALGDAIADLIARKPHLAAAPTTRFAGQGDGGARAPAKTSTQSIDDAIAAATAARNFALVATLKNQKASKKE